MGDAAARCGVERRGEKRTERCRTARRGAGRSGTERCRRARRGVVWNCAGRPIFILFSYCSFSFLLSWYNLWNLIFVFALCKPPSQPQQRNEQGQILEVAIEAAANAIIQLKDNLNEWDGKVGDGDCGSTVSLIHKTFTCLFLIVDVLCALLGVWFLFCRCIEVQKQFLRT